MFNGEFIRHVDGGKYMKLDLKNKIDIFVDNTRIMEKGFKWDFKLSQALAALLYTNEAKAIDIDRIKRAKNIIKENTGMFSQFKGNSNLIISTYLSLSPDPKQLFQDTLKTYQRMKEEGFHSSDYLAIAAFNIASQSESYNYEACVTRSKMFYDGIKSNHKFLTGQDDYIYSTMLGLTDLDIPSTIDRIEELYRVLKKYFSSSNAVQCLGEVLVLSKEENNILIKRVVGLYEKFKTHKYNLSGENILGILGILSLVTADSNEDEVVLEVIELCDYLKCKKGFGSFAMTKVQRCMFAISFIVSSYISGSVDKYINASLATSITNIIIAQQTAMIVAASSAAAASSASSS